MEVHPSHTVFESHHPSEPQNKWLSQLKKKQHTEKKSGVIRNTTDVN